MIALNMKDKIYRAWKEATKANRWDPNRKCYLDPTGKIIVEPSSVTLETLIESLKQEDEQRERDVAKKIEEEELKSKKINEGIIDNTKEMTAENLTKNDRQSAYGKGTRGKTDGAKTESDCKNCMKDCNVCSTHGYLTLKKTQDLVEKLKMVEKQFLNRDKLMRASNERIKELT
ncbi:hypothetical protein Hanom_Chr13g01210411 [Helianthus anomalus]